MKPHKIPCPCETCQRYGDILIDHIKEVEEKGYEAETIIESIKGRLKYEQSTRAE